MNDSPIEYDYEALRALIRAAFTDQELRRFCQDHRRFRPILSHFGSKFSLEEMIDVLIAWCQKRDLVPELLTEIETANPKQFAKYKKSLVAETPSVAPVSQELVPASSPRIPDRFKPHLAYVRDHRRGISLVLVLVLAVAVVVLAVIGVMNYLQQRQTPQFWIERFLGTKSADVRMVSLVRLVDVTGREEDAQNLYFEKLTAAEQVEMFSVSDPEGLLQDLIVAIRSLYVKLDNTPQSNRILEAMSEALPERSLLPAGVATELSLELEYWRRGRHSQGEGDYLSAVDSYMLAIGQNDANPSTRVDLASAYAAWGRYPDALVELERVLELDPGQRDAVEQVVNNNEGLYTYLGLHRLGHRDVAEFFPTLTPTPTPTYTPTPTSTPTPTHTSTPTPTPTDIPTSTPTTPPMPEYAGGGVVEAEILPVLDRYSAIRERCYGPLHDCSGLETVLSGAALRSMQDAVKWLSDNSAYYLITEHEWSVEEADLVSSTQAKVLTTRLESREFYVEGKLGETDTVYDDQYQVLYHFERIGESWLIVDRQVLGSDVTVTLSSHAALDGFRANNGGGNNNVDVRAGNGSMFGSPPQELVIRGFLDFDLTGIPASAYIKSIELRFYQVNVTGTPYEKLGKLLLQHVHYGSTLNDAAFDTPKLHSVILSPHTGSGEWYTIPEGTIGDWIEADLAAGRTNLQLRLQFLTETDRDGLQDVASFESGDNYFGTGNVPQLIITYAP